MKAASSPNARVSKASDDRSPRVYPGLAAGGHLSIRPRQAGSSFEAAVVHRYDIKLRQGASGSADGDLSDVGTDGGPGIVVARGVHLGDPVLWCCTVTSVLQYSKTR